MRAVDSADIGGGALERVTGPVVAGVVAAVAVVADPNAAAIADVADVPAVEGRLLDTLGYVVAPLRFGGICMETR